MSLSFYAIVTTILKKKYSRKEGLNLILWLNRRYKLLNSIRTYLYSEPKEATTCCFLLIVLLLSDGQSYSTKTMIQSL